MFSGRRVTVFGLGRFGGGIAVTRWLSQQNAQVLVVDQDPPEKLAASVAALKDLPIDFHLGSPTQSDFTAADLIVASPAVPPHNPFLAAARAAGVPITTEIRLFIERCPAQKILAVTGTKGKSTTTAMLGRMLQSRHTTFVGGNIGGSLLEKLPQISPSNLVVLELSSYMLEHLGHMRWSPHIALLTMIGSDHLEWHGSHAAYIDAKKNILRFQAPTDYAVLDPAACDFAAATKATVVPYTLASNPPFPLLVPGLHNQLNAQSAFAAAKILGITWPQAAAALADFPGLPHRLQLIHQANGVRWYNDSIATIPQAAIAALESFPPHSVIQILGGKDKHLEIASLIAALTTRAKAVLCIGATGPMLAAALKGASIPVHLCGDLPAAVTRARALAAANDTVLLSPGYPSLDQFLNFEQRGDLFTTLARTSPTPPKKTQSPQETGE